MHLFKYVKQAPTMSDAVLVFRIKTGNRYAPGPQGAATAQPGEGEAAASLRWAVNKVCGSQDSALLSPDRVARGIPRGGCWVRGQRGGERELDGKGGRVSKRRERAGLAQGRARWSERWAAWWWPERRWRALGAGTPECLGPALRAVSPSPICVAGEEHRSSVP